MGLVQPFKVNTRKVAFSKEGHTAHKRYCIAQVFSKGEVLIRMLTDEKNTFNCYSDPGRYELISEEKEPLHNRQ